MKILSRVFIYLHAKNISLDCVSLCFYHSNHPSLLCQFSLKIHASPAWSASSQTFATSSCEQCLHDFTQTSLCMCLLEKKKKNIWLLVLCYSVLSCFLRSQQPLWVPVRVLGALLPVQHPADMSEKVTEDSLTV